MFDLQVDVKKATQNNQSKRGRGGWYGYGGGRGGESHQPWNKCFGNFHINMLVSPLYRISLKPDTESGIAGWQGYNQGYGYGGYGYGGYGQGGYGYGYDYYGGGPNYGNWGGYDQYYNNYGGYGGDGRTYYHY